MSDLQKVLDIALAEVGYLEKASNSNLDSKTGNAGSGNFTKYWRDLSATGFQGQPWCNAFVNWCFVKAYGEAEAKKLLCTAGGWSYYTPTSAGYFKSKGQWQSKPQIGDIVYFQTNGTICHVGIVYNVDKSYCYTVEGNTSSESGVVANGGAVARKRYPIAYTRFAGFGRPAYGSASTTSTTTSTTKTSSVYSRTQFIRDVQSATGATIDGIAGPDTLKHTVTVSKTKNRTHAVVRPLQKYLTLLGYPCGTVDGVAGPKFDQAVRDYQRANGCTVDGEITAKCLTWKKLLGLS